MNENHRLKLIQTRNINKINNVLDSGHCNVNVKYGRKDKNVCNLSSMTGTIKYQNNAKAIRINIKIKKKKKQKTKRKFHS